jgi:hypothetical protein
MGEDLRVEKGKGHVKSKDHLRYKMLIILFHDKHNA